MNHQPKICPQPIYEACGQPVLIRSELPPLTRIQQHILDAVKRCPGISAEQLRCLVWQDDPNGGPECRHTIFVQARIGNLAATVITILWFHSASFTRRKAMAELMREDD